MLKTGYFALQGSPKMCIYKQKLCGCKLQLISTIIVKVRVGKHTKSKIFMNY